MGVDKPFILALNGGSSSIKVAVYRAGSEPMRVLNGSVERIGTAAAEFRLEGSLDDRASKAVETKSIGTLPHKEAAQVLASALKDRLADREVLGIGHRVVYGGPDSPDHQLITPKSLDQLRAVAKMDSTHLPREIALIEVFEQTFVNVPQVMCLDTAFHRTLPRIATLLPIPHRFEAMGLRRYGYHGLSYEYLMLELARETPSPVSNGKVVLAHLGSGASLAAVREKKPIDTTMAATALSGLMMGTRPGDLDPGAVLFMAQRGKLTPEQLVTLLNKECGLLGVSGISADVRDLLAKRGSEKRAADAIDLFCWIARKHVAAMTASLGGIDALVFAGGIGENSPEIRAGICDSLAYLGIVLDPALNAAGKGTISTRDSRTLVRVIRTNEELMIARHVQRLVDDRSLMETR